MDNKQLIKTIARGAVPTTTTQAVVAGGLVAGTAAIAVIASGPIVASTALTTVGVTIGLVARNEPAACYELGFKAKRACRRALFLFSRGK